MKKLDESKQQAKQSNYTLIALDLLARVAKDSNYIRHRDIVEVGDKIRDMVLNDITEDSYRILISDMVAHIVGMGKLTYGEYINEGFRDRVESMNIL